MSTLDPYLVNVNLDVHMRDARHAHQLYTEYGHAFSPKQKFLYHVVFQPSRAIADASLYNTFLFVKEIGVLVKSTDLPSFRASIENKQQYNRKKNVQTRIDYQDVRMTFHDDSVGATRSMLEEYYKWYYADGNQDITAAGGAYNPRDKYYSKVPTYGLNTRKQSVAHEIPFFEYIKIYQLSRKEWFSYTLVNPLLSAWQHGDLDYSDGSGMVENTITIAYEAVLYDKGTIGAQGEPTHFTSAETRYDNEMSPLGYADESIFEKYNLSPKLLNTSPNVPRGLIARMANSDSTINPSNINNNSQTGVLEQIIVPLQTPAITTTSIPATESSLNPVAIAAQITTNPSARSSFVAQAINTGAVPGTTVESYTGLSATAQQDITNGLINQINSNTKLASFANTALRAARGVIT